jgi:hypothetical protein
MSTEEDKTIPFPAPVEPGRAATPEEEAEVAPVPEAESTAPTEGEAPPEPEEAAAPSAVHIAKQARIEWLDDENQPKAEPEVEECWRSLAEVFIHLGRLVEREERKLEEHVRITLLITDEEGQPSTITNSKGEERSEVVLFENGTLEDALEHFSQIAMPAAVAYAKMQGAIAQISEMSTLKAAVVTLIFDDARPAGMVFMSDAVEVTDDDMVMAGSSGEHFIEQFKKAMREEKGLQFPGDSNIIIPGGMPPGMSGGGGRPIMPAGGTNGQPMVIPIGPR